MMPYMYWAWCMKMCEYGMNGPRNFLTKEEKLELLKEYKEGLEKETKGVSERIKELEKNN
jgi:hypothetical protein